MYNGVTLITQHVNNNLLAHVRNGSIHRAAIVLQLKLIFISIEYGVG